MVPAYVKPDRAKVKSRPQMRFHQKRSSESCSWYENPSGAIPCRFDSGPGHHNKIYENPILLIRP